MMEGMSPGMEFCPICTELNNGKPVHHPRPVGNDCPQKKLLENKNDERLQEINKIQREVSLLFDDNKYWKNDCRKLLLVIDRLKQEKKQ